MSVRGLFDSVEEPATTATDWLMALLAGVWAAGLLSAGAERGTEGAPTLVWGAAFVATALSALLGGLVHGWQQRMGARRAGRLWRATLHCLTAAGVAVTVAALLVFPASPLRTVAVVLVAAKFAAATAFLIRDPTFRVALTDYGTALGVAFALQTWVWWRHGAASSPWIAAGVLLSAVAGSVQALELAPHRRFNHNDLYHVLQIGALYLLYRGGLLLGPV